MSFALEDKQIKNKCHHENADEYYPFEEALPHRNLTILLLSRTALLPLLAVILKWVPGLTKLMSITRMWARHLMLFHRASVRYRSVIKLQGS